MEEKKKEPVLDLMAILDEWSSAVDIFTGCKNQLINAGWSANNAELIVIEALRNATADKIITSKGP